MTAAQRLIMLLGDQLSIELLDQANQHSDLILMAEVMDEATYVPHHKKKIAFLFSAMRHFAAELQEQGWQVHYTKLDDPHNSGTIIGEIQRISERQGIVEVIGFAPGEWRLLQQYEALSSQMDMQVHEDPRFLTSRAEFADWAEGRKLYRMEDFYRLNRKSTGLLMVDCKPEGGKWNYDQDNRKALKMGTVTPAPSRFDPDQITIEVLALVERQFAERFGTLDNFWFAVTRAQAEQAL